MADEYIDKEAKVSYNKYKPRDCKVTKEKSNNKQEPSNHLLSCYQVEEEATFDTVFELCEKCQNFKRDRIVATTRNGTYYKCTILWKRKYFGNKKLKPNPPLSFNERLLQVDDKPAQEGVKRRSNRSITPSRKYISDQNAKDCNQPVEEICNSTINIDTPNQTSNDTPPTKLINDSNTTTSKKFKNCKELEREVNSLKDSLEKLQNKYDNDSNKWKEKKASLKSVFEQSEKNGRK